MSRVWISKPVVSRIEEEAMSLSGFHYCICAFILCRCCSFSPSLGRLSPFLLPYVAVSRPCFAGRNLAQQAGPKGSGQNKCNQRRPTERWSYTKHYCTCCMGPMGLKSENEKRECEKKKTIPLMICMRLISLICQKNVVWMSHISTPWPVGAHLSPPCPSRVRGWRRMTFQTTYGYLRSWSRD